MADDGSYDLYETHMITRLALWLTMGIYLDALDLGWWSVTMIMLVAVAIDYLARIEGQQQGTMQGIANYISMTEKQQTEIRRLVEKWQKLN